MKIYLGFLLLLFISIYSCSPNNKKEQVIYFGGRVAHAESDSIYLLLNNREKAFALDFDGNFSDTIQIQDEGYKKLSIDREEFTLYLVPGDSLILDTDLNQIETRFTFTGKGSNRNNYLISKSFKTDAFLSHNSELFRLSPTEFRNQIKTFNDALLKSLDKIDVSSAFVNKEEKNLNYDYINFLYTYKDSFNYYNPTLEQLPINFLTELEQMDLDNDEDYRTYQSYRGIVLTDLQEKLYQGYSADALLQKIKSTSIKNGFLSSLIYELDPKDPNSEVVYKAIKKHCTYQPWLDEAEKRMKQN
jgi:hypothetical protein